LKTNNRVVRFIEEIGGAQVLISLTVVGINTFYFYFKEKIAGGKIFWIKSDFGGKGKYSG